MITEHSIEPSSRGYTFKVACEFNLKANADVYSILSQIDKIVLEENKSEAQKTKEQAIKSEFRKIEAAISTAANKGKNICLIEGGILWDINKFILWKEGYTTTSSTNSEIIGW